MPNTIKIKRGLEANRTSITPQSGELLYTTDQKKVYVGDGSTAGGIAVSLAPTFELISSATASASTSVAFTGLSSAYNEYIIRSEDVSSSGAANILLRTSVNNGSSYSSGASDYTYNRTYVSNAAAQTLVSQDATSIDLGQTVSSNLYGAYVNISILGAGASKSLAVSWINTFYIATPYRYYGVGFRDSQTAVNAVQISIASGTMTGTFKLYGVKA